MTSQVETKEKVLRAAYAYEQATRWHEQKPTFTSEEMG